MLAAPPFLRQVRAQGLTKLAYQTGWLAGTDKAGLYQAVAAGIYKAHGLDVEIKSGGPQLNVSQIFLAGRVDFADSDSFRVLNFAKEGLPAVAVAAMGQKSLTCLLSHPNVGNDSLAALKGKPIQVSTIGRQTYWKWLMAKYGFSEEQGRPHTPNLTPFLVNKELTIEAFINTEPFAVRRAGVEPVIHVLADHGYENYSSVTLAHPKMVAEKPDVVQRFVDATIKGWRTWLNEDPTPGNDAMKVANPDLNEEKLAFGRKILKDRGVFESGDAATMGIGAMSDTRWRRFYDSMVAAGALPQGIDIKRGYTLQFLRK
ncbi:MAG: ABC transporter substrate-binding protein [Rubrivivax sp.]|nr:ABC transporter substrate-binding protein [Rubrivivax sp.]MCL4698136.1 ABC transporter substrate-binding protein [Burkholderiaceae bacterium]